MARTLKDIYTGIISEKEKFSNLNTLLPLNSIEPLQALLVDLTTPSRVAVWRLWVYIVAFAIWIHETLWDLFKAEVETIVDKFRPGTLRWYQEQALLFQYGDLLVWDSAERKYKYSVIDVEKRVVDLCSVTEPSNVVRIKVAKFESPNSTNVVSLTPNELQALQAYFNRIKYPGKLICVSYSADILRIGGTIKYDPLAVQDEVQDAVEVSINNYIKNLEFDGRFMVSKMIDAVQSVKGVIDFTNVEVKATYGGINALTISDEYQTNAGYAEIGTAFPLSQTIQYQPYV